MSLRVRDSDLHRAISHNPSFSSEFEKLPEFVPLPPAKGTEFYSGLRRGSLNQLILPCEANDHRPPVKSVSLRRRGCVKGKRLIELASLLRYLRALQAEQSLES